MGIVYAAQDPRLNRRVAIKTIREAAGDERSRERFWREARAAASLSHPNICQIYELGEHEGAPYLVMEFLEGESLADRLRRGALPQADAVQIAVGMLEALEALHRRDLAHRDLKPSNVFLTPHGPKLLDFGLARSLATDADAATLTNLTQPGMILGTPRYMSPEQLQGQTLTAASDLFAAGALLYEMLTGQYAFSGDTILAVFNAVLQGPRPSLPNAPALDSIVRRALAVHPADRYPSARAMMEDLRGALTGRAPAAAAPAAPGRRQTRLMVLPFRLLRPDPDAEFLAFSLPDAITTSLSGLGSILVRSSLVAARFTGPSPDLALIAQEAQVDAVLTGTLLRAGDRVRISTQLVEAPAGAVLWSDASQVSLADIFQVQDELVQRIVASLAGPLTTREYRLLKHDVPAGPEAYEYYLRANQAILDYQQAAVARDLYQRCVELDPRYAPAWARLGRCHWILAKWLTDSEDDLARAEQAFERALALHPDLPLAHRLYARFEADVGRCRQAMLRLLSRAHLNPNDAELFAGLVHACRYSGLLDASVAAHRRAQQLDPQLETSVDYTYFLRLEPEAALANATPDIRARALAMLGRIPEALEFLRSWAASGLPGKLIYHRDALQAALEGRREACVEASEQLLSGRFADLEGSFLLARQLCWIGETARAQAVIASIVEKGFGCYRTLTRDPWLEALRQEPAFQGAVERAAHSYRLAQAAFRDAGGETLLGCPAA